MANTEDILEVLLAKMGNIEPIEGSKTAIEYAEKQIPANLFYEANSGKFKPETVASTYGGIRPLSIQETKEFEDRINACIKEIFQEGVHYGTVQGIKKKFLFKAGAEVISNMLGLSVRTEIIDKTEDYANAFFSYTCKCWLIDGYGVIRSEGLGACNNRENKYAKSNPYNVVNILIKLSKKRAFTDAVLGVASLSNKFSQDEDLVESVVEGKSPDELKSSKPRPATKKQLEYLRQLMEQHNNSVEAVNKYCQQNFNVDDFKKLNSAQISQLIEKYTSLG